MLSSIQGLLQPLLGASVSGQAPMADEDAIQAAIAALLVEVARADFDLQPEERAAVQRIIGRHFSVSETRASEIADAAERHSEYATSLHPLTRMLTTQCSMDERIGIVRLLWEVTFADGHVDRHEEHLIRKIADLLYVPHQQFIRARHELAGE